MATHSQAASAAAVEAVRQRLQGRRVDIGSRVFEGLLLLALVAAFAILVALLIDVTQRGLPVFLDRGLEFLTSEGSSRAA
ncbi:MAG: hypothetical protein ABIO99_00360, partial [Candidatus Limnocylindria bacterium]